MSFIQRVRNYFRGLRIRKVIRSRMRFDRGTLFFGDVPIGYVTWSLIDSGYVATIHIDREKSIEEYYKAVKGEDTEPETVAPNPDSAPYFGNWEYQEAGHTRREALEKLRDKILHDAKFFTQYARNRFRPASYVEALKTYLDPDACSRVIKIEKDIAMIDRFVGPKKKRFIPRPYIIKANTDNPTRPQTINVDQFFTQEEFLSLMDGTLTKQAYLENHPELSLLYDSKWFEQPWPDMSQNLTPDELQTHVEELLLRCHQEIVEIRRESGPKSD